MTPKFRAVLEFGITQRLKLKRWKNDYNTNNTCGSF